MKAKKVDPGFLVAPVAIPKIMDYDYDGCGWTDGSDGGQSDGGRMGVGPR